MPLVVTAGVSQNRYCAVANRFYKFRNYRQFHNCSRTVDDARDGFM